MQRLRSPETTQTQEKQDRQDQDQDQDRQDQVFLVVMYARHLILVKIILVNLFFFVFLDITRRHGDL